MTRLGRIARPTWRRPKLGDAGRRDDGAARTGAVRLREVHLPCRPLPHARGAESRTWTPTSSGRAAGIFTPGRVQRRRRIPQDRGRHEDGHQRLRGRRHRHHGWLRLSRPGPQHRRDAQLPRRPLHRRLPRIRAPPQQAADDLRVQRRLAVGQRHDRTTRSKAAASSTGPATTSPRRPRSCWSINPGGRVRRCAVRRRLQIGSMNAAGSVVTASSPAGECRQPARGDRAAQLHGAARRGGQLRPARVLPAPWPRWHRRCATA